MRGRSLRNLLTAPALCILPLSQRSTNPLFKCLRRYRKKVMTWGCRIFFKGWKRIYKAILLLPAETLIAEIAETFVHPPAILRMGVLPTSAQVFLTVGTRQNPLSSRKTRGILSFSDFFYMRPLVALPMRYFLLIAFPGPGLGFLIA